MSTKRGFEIYLIQVFIIFVFFIGLTGFVSADIFLTQQPKDVYNIGDEMSIILGSDGSLGWASMSLICGDSSQIIYFHYLTKSETKNPVSVPLTKEFLKGAKGDCYISLLFEGIEKKSFSFIITDKIDVSAKIDKISIYPNESFSFSGYTKKANGQEFNGIVDINFRNTDIQTSVPVKNNKFEGSLLLPEDIASRNYEVNFFVSEKDVNGEVINSGSDSLSINVLPKPTKLVIEAPQNVSPGGSISFKAELYDQANSIIPKKPVAITIIDSKGKKAYDSLRFTGESNSLNLLTSSPYGLWNINALSEGLNSSANVFIEKYKAANYSFINNSLKVFNVGNVPFDKTIEIKIGNYSETKYPNISVGGYDEFFLEAPDGNYNIRVSDGNALFSFNGYLTGNVIAIKDKKFGDSLGLGFFKKNFFAWIFLFLILGSFIFIAGKRGLNRRFKITNKQPVFFSSKPEEKKGGVIKISSSSDKIQSHSKHPVLASPSLTNESIHADHSLIISGEKQSATLLAIKIKNMAAFDQKKSNINERLHEIVKEISANKGKIYKSNDFIIGIFAPVITRTFDNSLNAIKTANLIANKIKSDNHKFHHKIDFGISVHDGEIVAKKENGKLVFTPLGHGFLNVKKIAEMSNNDILISESTNKKIASKVKTILNPEHLGIKTYSIKEIVDKEENKKFIEGFLKRNNEIKQLRDFRMEGLKS